jgi:hypothetical protein
MAHHISFKGNYQWINNRLFRSLLEFSVIIGEEIAASNERPYVELMKKRVAEGFFWDGRSIDIAEDFTELSERKFWSRVFYEMARAIFDRKLGIHEHRFWQAQRIHLAYGLGELFEEAVNEAEPRWNADTLDRREFEQYESKQ